MMFVLCSLLYDLLQFRYSVMAGTPGKTVEHLLEIGAKENEGNSYTIW